MILDDFIPDKIHYIDTDYQISSILQSLLMLGLDFIPTPCNYKQVVHIYVMMYSKQEKRFSII
jgi:hypothetical protein